MRNRAIWPLLILTMLASPGISHAEEQARYSYSISKKVTIDGDLLGKCLAKAAFEAFGQLEISRRGIRCVPFAPKIITCTDRVPPKACRVDFFGFRDYLQGDPCRDGDYVTGTEKELKAWILSQPDGTLDPPALFRKSIQLNKGDILSATVSLHEVFRNTARWRNKQRYMTSGSVADETVFFNKLIDIRGDLKERGNQFKGDHAGSWYRIWGVILGRLVLEGGETELFARQRTHACTVTGPKVLEKTSNFFKDLVSILPIRAAQSFEADRVGKRTTALAAEKAGTSLLNSLRYPEVYLSGTQACERRDYLKLH